MSIYRIRKREKFVTISNEIARNSSLSWEARGLLLYLLSQADGWEVIEADLLAQGPAGRDKVRRMLEELKAAGHFRRIAVRQQDGTFRYVTEIYEEPPLTENPEAAQNEPLTGKPLTAEPLTAEPLTANPTLRKTDESKTYLKPLNAREGHERPPEDPSRNRPGEDGGAGGEVAGGGRDGPARRPHRLPDDWTPTDADRAYAAERGLHCEAEAEHFADYWHAEAGPKSRKLDWGAAWRTWCRNSLKFAARVHRPAAGIGGGARLSPHEQLGQSAEITLAIRREMRRRNGEGAMGSDWGDEGREGARDAEGVLLALPAPARGRGG